MRSAIRRAVARGRSRHAPFCIGRPGWMGTSAIFRSSAQPSMHHKTGVRPVVRAQTLRAFMLLDHVIEHAHHPTTRLTSGSVSDLDGLPRFKDSKALDPDSKL